MVPHPLVTILATCTQGEFGHQLQIWPLSSKFGHQVAPLALVPMLFTGTRLGHMHCHIAWNCPLTLSVSIELVSSSARVTSVKFTKRLKENWTHRSDQGYLGPIKITQFTSIIRIPSFIRSTRSNSIHYIYETHHNHQILTKWPKFPESSYSPQPSVSPNSSDPPNSSKSLESRGNQQFLNSFCSSCPVFRNIKKSITMTGLQKIQKTSMSWVSYFHFSRNKPQNNHITKQNQH